MTAQKIQPPFLKWGDEVAIVSPSFCIDENILYEVKGNNAFLRYV